MLEPKSDWLLEPIPGGTGNAYMGIEHGHKVFVKKDPSPILANVAQLGITPRLLWSRRTPNGDSQLSAQEWIDGHILSASELTSDGILYVLRHLHSNRTLIDILTRLGYTAQSPADLIATILDDPGSGVHQNAYLKAIAQELADALPPFDKQAVAVVHGDVNHRNWMMTTTGRVYLVDWDTVLIADPMLDVAHILSHYIPQHQWGEWLRDARYSLVATTYDRLKWYGHLAYLRQIDFHFKQGDLRAVNKEIQGLREFRESFLD